MHSHPNTRKPRVLGTPGARLQGGLTCGRASVAWIIAEQSLSSTTNILQLRQVGKLLGTRTVLNELIAFGDLGTLKQQGILMDRSIVIASFALCGFANISSIGIQLGGIGALAPERRHDLARLGMRALLAGTLANYLSACIAGVLL